MAAPLLTTPPNDGHLWIPPDALPGVKIRYTLGRNDGNYLNRKLRAIITTEASHTMGGSSTESMQGFANAEMGASATLAEVATFTDGSLLQSLPLDLMGVGSVALTPWGLTHESAEMSGDPNAQPWTPVHMDTKVALTAWLIRNPLLKAGDRKWAKLQIPYQVCVSPYPNTPALGGLGFHTQFGDCGLQAGGTNPWSLYCKSCPGYMRRGYPPGKFPGLLGLPNIPGNFRDYVQRVGAALATNPEPTPPEEEDMANYVKLTGNDTWFQDGAVVMRVPSEDVPKDHTIRDVSLAYFKRRGLSGPLPGPADGTDPKRQWTAADFLYLLPDGVKGDKGDPGEIVVGQVIPGEFKVTG